jgi:hypothetical protein
MNDCPRVPLDLAQKAEDLLRQSPVNSWHFKSKEFLLANTNSPWVVAFSGGADSLLILLLVYAAFPEIRDQLTIAHFNHNLRGDESNQLKTTNPYMVFNATSSWKPLDNFEMFARINNILNSKYETMGVLGEASASEVNVPISELGDTGSGTAVGALDPRFLSPGSPLGIYFGVKISW